nr:alpha-amylase family glycosyl hydrolase [Lysinibacillus timonensis]
MKFKKWISTVVATILAASLTVSPVVHAEETKNIADESIYELLVDRFFNSTNANDFNTNPHDPTQFAGGDFTGIIDKLSTITKMGFSIVSLGPIFSTERYDGSLPTSYSEIEPHFGTADELKQLVQVLQNNNIRAMIDFPLSNVSENHEWAQDPNKQDWVLEIIDGKVRWDLTNEEVQTALIDAIVQFVSTYHVGGVRLTNLNGADTAFTNEMIQAIKDVDEDIYVISNEDSDANFDASYYEETNESFRSIYKNVDYDSTGQMKYVEPYVNGEAVPTQLMIDHINTDRFIFDAEAFPPTRLKLALAATFLLPGLPVMQYGTEIAMNGSAGPESHQLYNFKTEEELVEFIKNIQTLRSQSTTLRSGEFELLRNENGFLAFKRSSEEETWIVVINNSGQTTRLDVSSESLGEGKELQAMLDSDVVRENEEGNFPIVLDREIVEIYQVIDEKGINIPYLIALGLVYIIFISFIVAIMRRAKRNRKENE